MKIWEGKALLKSHFCKSLNPESRFCKSLNPTEPFHQAWRPTHRKKEKAISHVGKRPRAEEMKSHQLAVGAVEVEQESQIKWGAGTFLRSIWAPALHRLTLATAGRGGQSSIRFQQPPVIRLVQGQHSKGEGAWARLFWAEAGRLTILSSAGSRLCWHQSPARRKITSNRTSLFLL